MAVNDDDLLLIAQAAKQAGEIALGFYKSENEVWMKPGDSPVSQADLSVNKHLEKILRAARPDYGWLSEENEDDGSRHECQRTFFIDPIDGTRGFLSGIDQWCISIALVENYQPVVAVLECPSLNETYLSQADAQTKMNGTILDLSKSVGLNKASGSRKMNETLESDPGLQINAREYIPSLAYRFAMVSNGAIEAGFAKSGARDWDLAAIDLILANAGGLICDENGDCLSYNAENLRKPALIACPAHLKNETLALANSTGILH